MSGDGGSGGIGLDGTHVAVAAGPLAGPVISRVIAIAAARAHLPVDRLSDALAIADAVVEHATPLVAKERLELATTGAGGWLELRVGPLRHGSAGRLLERSEPSDAGGVIVRLATRTRVISIEAGDVLVIDVAAAP